MKFLIRELQLLFEFVNKVLLPCYEKCIVTSVVDLFLMKDLSKFKLVNLPALMIELIHKVMHIKDGKHGLPYRYFLTGCLNTSKYSVRKAFMV